MLIEEVELAPGVGAWFTGRDLSGVRPPIGSAGNLSHTRPHRPNDLAAARAEVARHTGTDAAAWHHMRQRHGAAVAVVDAATPVGAELRGVDAVVTAGFERPLVVQVADCVPLLLAGATAVAAVHAGRRGVQAGVVANALEALDGLRSDASGLRAAIGPAIGGCCYEVPAELQEEVAGVVPVAAATTTWGTPSLDLPEAVAAQLGSAGVRGVVRSPGCTRCDPAQRWFSHRADAGTGRQIGLIVRRRPPAAEHRGGSS